ncbi:hypothetical protein F1559_003709 [Cyanidiococcus yangmingshanensis]|uniref:DUF3464 family protein n=1 Tax=Cyanidiococcus yangmingshanensis TaxID=2690220 RepID=A0A7J7IE40_9RHOD|nr:hypothetical protein F1559_003709 [Cyanidiococcus yangmingshanensis]
MRAQRHDPSEQETAPFAALARNRGSVMHSKGRIFVGDECCRPSDHNGSLEYVGDGRLAWVFGVEVPHAAPGWTRSRLRLRGAVRRTWCSPVLGFHFLPHSLWMRQNPRPNVRPKSKVKPLRWAETAGTSNTEGDVAAGPAHGVDSGPVERALPLVVAERMQRRMVVFAGVPFLLGISAFGVFFLLKYRYDIVVIPPVVGYATLGLFGLSLIGLTYGIMSASWDPGRVGTPLGWEEAQRNFLNTVDGFWRARMRERLDDADAPVEDGDDADASEDSHQSS